MQKPFGRLDQPEGRLDRRAMLRHTLTALDQLPSACAQFRKQLRGPAHPTLEELERGIRQKLKPKELTAWFQAEIPKMFKLPSDDRLLKSSR